MNIYLNFAVKEDLFETTKPTNQRSPITKYHPFGMGMKGRGFTVSGEYRYGWNTQEKEPELGNSLTSAEFWVYDGKLGRRWNLDPVLLIEISGFSVLCGMPIIYNDIKGDFLNLVTGGIGAAGAIAGGVAGLTMGASLAVSATVGAIAYAGQSIADDVIDHKKINYQKAIINGIAGSVSTGVASLLTNAVNAVKPVLIFSSNKVLNFVAKKVIPMQWTSMGGILRNLSNKLFYKKDNNFKKLKGGGYIKVGPIEKIEAPTN